MRKLIILAVVILVNGYVISAQSAFSGQMKAAQNYLNLIMKGKKEDAWQLFDKTYVPNFTKERFEEVFTYTKNSLNLFDTFALLSAISQVVNNRTLKMYRFKAQSKGKHILTDVFVDLTFVDTSELVGGLRSFSKEKDSTSLTSKSKETLIEKQFVAIIEKKNYNIQGINIVHLDNKTGLLAIQIARKISPDEFKDQQWTKTEAVKFAKYLVANGYIEKANQKAIELHLNFSEDVGVSFIDPATGQGINVPLNPKEFR